MLYLNELCHLGSVSALGRMASIHIIQEAKQHNAYELVKKPQLGAASTEEQLLAERAIGVNIMLCRSHALVRHRSRFVTAYIRLCTKLQFVCHNKQRSTAR